jgi:hypothetical protein
MQYIKLSVVCDFVVIHALYGNAICEVRFFFRSDWFVCLVAYNNLNCLKAVVIKFCLTVCKYGNSAERERRNLWDSRLITKFDNDKKSTFRLCSWMVAFSGQLKSFCLCAMWEICTLREVGLCCLCVCKGTIIEHTFNSSAKCFLWRK